MADTKISLLTAAAAQTGAEIFPVVQGGVTVGMTTAQVRTLLALLAGPAFTGVPTAPTAAPGNNSTQLSTTAYADLKSNIASPTFTGIPAAPTAAALNATTQVSTTAYVDAADSVSTINSQSAAYTLILSDAGKTIYHPSADTVARIWTIPANASVVYPVGTNVYFDNDIAGGVLTIAITTDTLVLVGAAGTTGSRTLAAGGFAVARKVSATRWRISGTAELT